VEIQFIVLDDATDTTRTVVNARKFVDEEHVDAIIGSATAQQCSPSLRYRGREDADDLQFRHEVGDRSGR